MAAPPGVEPDLALRGRVERHDFDLAGEAACDADIFCLAGPVLEAEPARIASRLRRASAVVAVLPGAAAARLTAASAWLGALGARGFRIAAWRNREHAAQVIFEREGLASPARRALVLDALGLSERALAALKGDPDSAALLDSAYARAARLDGFGPAAPATDPIAPAGQIGWDRARNPILVSIHIQSNKPENLRLFFDRVANSCDDPSRIEVIVKIDDDHEELNRMLPEEVARQPFQLKYISTPLVGGFFELWRSMNDMLAATDPGAYFLLNLNDEMVFLDRGWDTRLERYVGLFKDDLFRLRTSIFRMRNYHDHWECGFAPETSAVTTKKWIETGGNWNPCLGPDTFQQCVAYYFNRLNWHLDAPQAREVPIEDLRFGGEGAYIGLSGDSLRRRVRGATKAWFRLMSEEIQTEAQKRAAKLHAAIIAEARGEPPAPVVDEAARLVRAPGGQEIRYGAPRRWYDWVNARRAPQFAAWGGGGAGARAPLARALPGFLALRYDWAEKIRTWTHMVPAQASGVLDPLHMAVHAAARLAHLGAHAPDYAQLFYLRYVRHWLNLADLMRRRAFQKARAALWWTLIGGPRRLMGYADYAARRGGGSAIGWTLYGLVRAASFAKRAAWWALIGGPRRAKDAVQLAALRFWNANKGLPDLWARRGLGLAKVAAWWTFVGGPRRAWDATRLRALRTWNASRGWPDLAVRRTVGFAKVAAWWTFVGGPRRAWGAARLHAVQAWNAARGWSELAARRAYGFARVAAWWAVVGGPRRGWDGAKLLTLRTWNAVKGWPELAARRSLGFAKVAAWWTIVGGPRRGLGLAGLYAVKFWNAAKGTTELTARRSVGFIKIAAWRVLVWAPRWLGGHARLIAARSVNAARGWADLGVRRAFGAAKVMAWWVLIGAPRRLGGNLALVAVRSWNAAKGWSALAVRRGAGFAKVAAWWALIGAPRWAGGHLALAARRGGAAAAGWAALLARRSFGSAKVLAWWTLVGGPRRAAGLVALAGVRSTNALIGWTALGARRMAGSMKVAAWWALIGIPRLAWSRLTARAAAAPAAIAEAEPQAPAASAARLDVAAGGEPAQVVTRFPERLARQDTPGARRPAVSG
jgi:hypothetical protein